MAKIRNDDEMMSFPSHGMRNLLIRWAVIIGVPVAGCLVLFLFLWNTFFHYVPPGKMLIIISKDGTLLPTGQVLADKGQKGIQKEVLGEGWHFVLPIVYTTELKENVIVPAGKVGIVESKGGSAPTSGTVLAENWDERGILRQVLPPGAYRLNPYGYVVKLVPVTEIRPGNVGVMRRRLGQQGSGRFSEKPDDVGILREVLQPGLYYINTEEYEVIPGEIGIDQTSYRYDPDPHKSTAISFSVKDGNTIEMECTIEWEVLPENIPLLVAEYGNWHRVEANVIDQQARKISRDRGFNYGAQDFLEGEKREQFQADFTQELERVCKEKNVVVRSAFIRNLIIPEDFLRPKREKQLAAETKLTNEAKEKTAQSDAEVEREKRLIVQRVTKVQAETAALVALIDRDVENTTSRTDAEIDKLKNEYQAQIAELEAARTRILGDAETQVTKLKETAKSNLFKLNLEVFQNDSNAYLKYVMAKELNPKMVFRLFHAGPGTFWTNMDNKNMNLMLPVPGAAAETKPKMEKP